MITIKEIHIESANGKSRLSGLIEIDGDSHCLWVSVDEKYEKYLCAERCDGFVLGLLHYAMQHGHDICSEVPMTDRLYSQLTEQFLPAFSKINQFQRNKKSFSSGWDVRIFAPLASEVEHPACGEAIGTGCSCGVDSMHVYLEHPEITHSCVWNVHGVSNDETTEKREIGWHNIVSQATKFSKEAGTDILIADSNFDRGGGG